MDNELRQEIETLQAEIAALKDDRLPRVDRASKRRDKRQVFAGFGLFAVAVMIAGTMSASALSGSNTVLSDDIKDTEVHGSDINANAVSSAKVKDNSLTGADISESTIPGFKKVYYSRVSSLGTQIGGNATSVSRPGTGIYYVTFPFPIGQCASTATVASFSDNPAGNIFQHGNIATVDVSRGAPNTASVSIYSNAGAAVSLSFALTVICP